MTSIDIKCGFCGNVVTVDRSYAGSSRACPACGQRVEVVEQQAVSETPEPAPEMSTGEITKNCPGCGRSSGIEASFCSNCGYDWRPGPFNAKLMGKPWLVSREAVIALMAIIAVLLALNLFQKREAPVAAQADTTAPREQVGGLPTGSEQRQSLASLLLDQPAEGSASQAETEEAAANELVETLLADSSLTYTKAELEEMQDRYRRKLTQQLDKKHPRFERGETVALRKMNGMIQRGTFIGVKKGIVVVMQEDVSFEIPLTELDRTTRVRCDSNYRNRMIAAKLRQHMRELSNL